MRLWHIDLIEVLPDKQLKGQWRELNCFFVLDKMISHLLINFVYKYELVDLFRYSTSVLSECRKRGYRINAKKMTSYFEAANILGHGVFYNRPFAGKMTDRYLRQCYYNLQEKYDCGGMSEEEWKRIEDKVGGKI